MRRIGKGGAPVSRTWANMDDLIPRNELLEDPNGLRSTSDCEGVLFFRGLLNPDDLLTARRDILDLCERAGWLKPGTDPMLGVVAEGSAFVEPQPEFMAVYNQLLCLESFHDLAHSLPLIRLFDTLFDEPTLVHARNIARLIFPNNTLYTTPAHQDFVHVQGTENTWTAWIPLGDCPRELGALALMPGSHRQGVFQARAAYGAGGLGIDTDTLPYGWRTADFRCGDVVVFHSLLIHKALPNLSADRLRLSVDFRYQGASQPATLGSFLPHHGQITWETVYSGWKSRDRQYYWHEFDIRYADFTREYHDAARQAESPR